MPAARLAGAIAGSLVLHGAMFAALDVLPRNWQAGDLGNTQRGTGQLQVSVQRGGTAAAPRASLPGDSLPARGRERARAAGELHEPAAGFLPAPTYYPTDQLDRRPQPLVHLEPRFPATAEAPSGRVLLALYISEEGLVERIEVDSAAGNEVFASAAREAFSEARFLPGARNGVAVKSVMRVEVRFGEALPHTPEADAPVDR